MMTSSLINRIIRGLSQRSSAVYERAERRAKAAFVSWAVSLPLDTDVRGAARHALAAVDRIEDATLEIELFRSYLEAATRPPTRAVRGRGQARLQRRQHGGAGSVH